jgi:integrase
MASFRKRSNGWQARIRRKGYPNITKTFSTRSDAIMWARKVESDIDKGAFVSRVEVENTTLAELLIRYLNEITPHKKHFKVEACRIKAWLKNPLSQRYLSTLRTSDFALWRDDRVKEGKSSNTVKLELAIISHLYSIARAEWGFESLENPIRYLRIPKLPSGRTRRVSDSEIQLLISHSCSKELPNILKLAVETGMRRGEIISIKWKAVDILKRTIELKDTKNGESRIVPLSTEALNLLKSIPRRIDGKVFDITAHAITYAFIRACKRAGISDLHFHDLRHEAITRMFEKGLNVMEVGSVSGHKTLQMLKRYTHLRAEELALKLG